MAYINSYDYKRLIALHLTRYWRNSLKTNPMKAKPTLFVKLDCRIRELTKDSDRGAN